MKIEILFNDICNQFGDTGNTLYLEKLIEEEKRKNNTESKIIYTSIHDELAFLTEEVDIVYIGSLSESKKKVVLEKLNSKKEEILASIARGQVILATGNAFDLFGEYIILDRRYEENQFIISPENKNTTEYYDAWIKDETGNKTGVNMLKIPERYILKGLGIYNTVAVTDMLSRSNGYCMAEFVDMKILGHKSSFTQSYILDETKTFPYMAKVKRGRGMNRNSNTEGVRIMNFFSTYVLGPILVLNPDFTQYLLELVGYNKDLFMYEEMKDAYDIRLNEFNDKKRVDIDE